MRNFLLAFLENISIVFSLSAIHTACISFNFIRTDGGKPQALIPHRFEGTLTALALLARIARSDPDAPPRRVTSRLVSWHAGTSPTPPSTRTPPRRRVGAASRCTLSSLPHEWPRTGAGLAVFAPSPPLRDLHALPLRTAHPCHASADDSPRIRVSPTDWRRRAVRWQSGGVDGGRFSPVRPSNLACEKRRNAGRGRVVSSLGAPRRVQAPVNQTMSARRLAWVQGPTAALWRSSSSLWTCSTGQRLCANCGGSGLFRLFEVLAGTWTLTRTALWSSRYY